MHSGTPALLACLLLSPQEEKPADLVTLPASGTFKAMVQKLSEASRIPVRLGDGIEDKNVEVDVRNGSFFLALDSLCRAHGDVNYLGQSDRHYWPPEHLTLNPQPWLDHPTIYSGAFKVVLEGWVRTQDESAHGTQDTTVLYLSALPPPDRRFVENRAGSTWTLSELKDGRGNDLLLPADRTEAGGRGPTRLELEDLGYQAYALRHPVEIRSFDAKDGFGTLKGKLLATAAHIEDVRIPLEKGKKVDFTGGTLTVTGVASVKVYTWKDTRVTLSVERKAGAPDVEQLFDSFGTYDGNREGWGYLRPELRDRVAEFDLHSPNPKWMVLRVRKNVRDVTVPFEFPKVSFEERRR